MKSYKGWTPAQRLASLKKTKAAIKNGEIPKPSKCNRCGLEKGIIHYHNENYSHPTKYLEQLCWTCHMMHHSKRRTPISHVLYFEQVEKGIQPEPVYYHDFKHLDKYIVDEEKDENK